MAAKDQFTVAEVGLARRIGVSREASREWREGHLTKGVDFDTVGKNVMLTASAAEQMTAAMVEKNAEKNALGAAEPPEPLDPPPAGLEAILDSIQSGNESNFAPSAEKNGGGAPELSMRDAGEGIETSQTPAAIEVGVVTPDPAGSVATPTGSTSGLHPYPKNAGPDPVSGPTLITTGRAESASALPQPTPEAIPMRVTRCGFKNTRLVEAQRLDGGPPVLVRVKDATKFVPRMEIPVRSEGDALGGGSYWVLARANPRWRGKW